MVLMSILQNVTLARAEDRVLLFETKKIEIGKLYTKGSTPKTTIYGHGRTPGRSDSDPRIKRKMYYGPRPQTTSKSKIIMLSLEKIKKIELNQYQLDEFYIKIPTNSQGNRQFEHFSFHP